MNIGARLNQARIEAKLTQEQVAAALGVSRQTISNWENGKTYPDIVSVIKLSDLYEISLDLLLKGKDPPTTDYIDYLAHSTNTVKSRQHLSTVILMSVYLAIWAFALIVFWCFTSSSDAMGYSVLFLWLVLPVSTLVISILLGKASAFGAFTWLLPLSFGFMHLLAEYATFSLANMIAIDFSRINPPAWDYFLFGAVVALIGVGLGTLARRIKKRKIQ